MTESLTSINPQFDHIQESQLELAGKTVAWHSTVQLKDGHALGSGFKPTREEARRVACAEFIERSFMLNCDSDTAKAWRFDTYPTACGLAVGFEREKNIIRSVVEGTERWVMTEWIARKRAVPEVNVSFNEIEKYFLNPFIEVRTFLVSIPVDILGNLTIVHVALLLAFTEDGVFPGSNASTQLEGIWTHAALEAQRHWLCVKNFRDTGTFPYDRIFYFAKNRIAAIAQLPDGPVSPWQIPKIEFFKESELYPGIFAARTIMKGFENWASSPKTQFLY